MNTSDSIRLWRVELVNRNGYQAPSQLIEAKKRDVHSEVRKLNLRLLDFPKVWSYRLIDLHKEFDSKRGKWVESIWM
jgi:hypothetical protein